MQNIKQFNTAAFNFYGYASGSHAKRPIPATDIWTEMN